MIERYNNIYLGIVIQNNDPEYRGRVKVWVPHISANVYNKWAQLKQDQTFAFPGSPNGENLSAILPELRNILPWAEYASPIAGGSTAGYYNAPTDTNSVSDASLFYGQPGTNTTTTSSATNIDPEGKGGKPGALFESNPVSDAFGNTAKIGSQYVNPNASTYKPATYSNAAKGVFAVPNVGSHIWVFFREGNPLHPVYMAAAYGQQEFSSIFKSGDGSYPDYPGTYENKKITSTDSSIYRNKMVVNQRGAAIEIINTTDRESYKVTHFNGGYYELNNNYTSLFNPKNFQLFTLADKFETVNGNSSSYIQRDNDYIVQGDYWLKVGNFNFDAVAQWNALYQQIVSNTDQSSIATTLQSLSADIVNQEKGMGFGGNSFEHIAKHKVVTIGLQENTTPSYLLDTSFVTFPGTNIVTGITPNLIAGYYEPTVELFPSYGILDVPDMPGGNLDIFAMSRFKVQAGTGGASITTTGNVKVHGGIVNMTGDQVNVGTNVGQVGINGKLVTINADILSIRSNVPDNQVVVDSSLGVSKNVIIGGGAYVEGELFVNHITAPVEYQVTENTQIYAEGPPVNDSGSPGKIASGWAIEGALANGVLNVTAQEGDLSVVGNHAILSIDPGSLLGLIGGILNIAQPHSHVFKNIPLSLLNQKTGPNDFNKYAADTLKNSSAAGSSPREDGRKPTIGTPGPGNGVGEYIVEGTSFNVVDNNVPNGPGVDVAGPVKLPI